MSIYSFSFFSFFLFYFDRAENHCKYPVLMLKSIMKYEKNTSTNLVFVFKFQQRLKRTPLRFSTASEVRVFLIPFLVSDVAYVSFTVEGIFFT